MCLRVRVRAGGRERAKLRTMRSSNLGTRATLYVPRTVLDGIFPESFGKPWHFIPKPTLSESETFLLPPYLIINTSNLKYVLTADARL